MKETYKFTLDLEVDIDGKRPSDDVLVSKIIAALNDNRPSILFDDDVLDCAVFAESWAYEVME
jgi:hypothetical protein